MRCLGDVSILLVLTLLLFHTAEALTIENHVSRNHIMGLDYRDGTLAVGTTAGLYLLSDSGELRMLTKEDGLPANGVPRVALADSHTLYIGPYPWGSYFVGPQSVYRLSLNGSDVSVEDITPAQGFLGCETIFKTAPDGALWVGDSNGLFRFDGDDWQLLLNQPTILHITSLSFSSNGTAYVSAGGDLFEIAGNVAMPISAPFYSGTLAADHLGGLWATGGSGSGASVLWHRAGAEWEVASSDPAWGWEPNAIIPDQAGRVWGVYRSRLALYEQGLVKVFDESAGMTFDFGFNLLSDFFLGQTLIRGETLAVGTNGRGVLLCDGEEFTRAYFPNCIAGDGLIDLCEDSNGHIWTSSADIPLLGVFDGASWDQVDGFWGYMEYIPMMANDIDGTLWVRSEDGAANYDGSSWRYYDSTNSPIHPSGSVAVDATGTKWFTNPMSDDWQTGGATDAALSFDGETWRRYSSTDCFACCKPCEVNIGPGDVKWFKTYDGGNDVRYTSFDGESWQQHGEYWSHRGDYGVFFDIHGNALLLGYDGLSAPAGPYQWDLILEASVIDVQSDTDGRLWCPATDGLYFGNRDSWEKIERGEGGIADAYDFLDKDRSWDFQLRVLIDHNGDKWVGTSYGLSRVEDGGAAAQKLTLRVEEGETTIALMGEFINTYTTMPVSLWLACDYGGTLYFYPDWTPTMGCTDMVLEAHLFEERELCSFDKASLPLGTLTFIGGISLRGGSDLMIGPRDNKLSFASFEHYLGGD